MGTNPKDFQKTAVDGPNNDIFGVNVGEGASTADMNDGLRGAAGIVAPPADFGDTAGAILIDDIAESTPDAGVRIDGVLLKDGGLPEIPMYTQPVGVMMAYGGDTAPALWLLCDGSEVDRTTYAVLFAALDTKYGAGNGTTTFNLPDKRGRVSVGAGAGVGLTVRAVGDAGGAESVTLTGAQSGLPAHDHPIGAGNSGPGSFVTPSPAEAFGDATTKDAPAQDAAETHENMPPFQADNWIIYAGV